MIFFVVRARDFLPPMKYLLGAALVLALQLPLVAAEASTPIPIEAFLADAEFRNPKLSPAGASLALIMRRDFADALVLLNADTLQPTPGPTLTNLRLVNYWWKGETKLLLLVQEATNYAYFVTFDLTTSKSKEIRAINRRPSWVVNPLAADPENVLLGSETSTGIELRKANLLSEKVTVTEKNPGWVQRWLTGRNGDAVAGLGREGGAWFMLVREKPGSDWRRVELGNRSVPDFWPLAVAADQRRIIGYDYRTADTARVVARDSQTGAEELLFHHPEVDADSNIVWGDDETRVRAIAYETDRPRFHYLDINDGELALQIDRALPGTVNSIISTSADESKLLIHAASDVVPERFHLLNRRTGRLTPLGGARGALNNVQLAPSRHLQFTARDGQALTGRIILPESGPRKPGLIVSAGADLTSRARKTYQPFMQLLASRGYAVLEVNHRGVDGFGQSFAKAGEMKIATTMGDDLADGARHVIAQGWVDPTRVVMLGQNDGGVLALHTLVRYPELFRAWINLETPLDADAVGAERLAFGIRETGAGGSSLRATDEFRLRRYGREIDPSAQLEKVRVPSFHYYGRYLHDRSGRRAEKTLKGLKQPYDYLIQVEFPRKTEMTTQEIDRFSFQETLRIYTRMVQFLERLGAPRTGTPN